MAARIHELRQKLGDAKKAHQALLDKHLSAANAGGTARLFTAEEKAEQAASEGNIAALGEMVTAEERRLELDTPPSGSRIEIGAANIAQDPFRGFRLAGASKDRFDMGAFGRAVHAASRPGGQVDRRLIEGGLWGGAPLAAPANYHQETGSTEGAMVPPVVATDIWQLTFADPLLDTITIEPTSGNSVDLLADETTPWGNTGIIAGWRSEGVQMSATKLLTNTRQVKVQELYAFVLATQELLDDAPRLGDRLTTKAAAAIRWKIIESFMFGTGAGQPLGWAHANYAGKILVNRANANQINATDIANLERRILLQDGADRAFYVTNRDTLPQLIGLVIGQQPVWLPPSGMAGRPLGSLMGRPLFFSEHAQTLGTQGDLQVVNPDGYYAVQRGQSRQDSSIHLFFDYNVTAFRYLFRIGGQPMLSAPVAAAKGANTKSHFVVLN